MNVSERAVEWLIAVILVIGVVSIGAMIGLMMRGAF